MSKPAKQVIPYATLLEKVQGLLIGQSRCRNLHIDSLDVYQEPRDGANWHVTKHRQSGNDNDWTDCWEFILPDIRQLRASYDVETS